MLTFYFRSAVNVNSFLMYRASRSIAMGDIEKLCLLARKYVVPIMWSHGYPSIHMIINELFKGVDDEEMPKPPFTRDRRHGNNMLYNRIYDMGYDPNLRIVDDGFTKVFESREAAYADLSGLKPIRAELLQERYDVFRANVDNLHVVVTIKKKRQ